MHDRPADEAGVARDSGGPSPVAAPRLSIVVPCHNEEACLREFYRRASQAARHAVGDNYQLVLVDDGSRDGTWAMMRDLAERDPRVLALRLSRNHGQNLALSAGLDLCRGELVLIIDADLQDQPELLGPMLDRLEAENADVVYAVRTHRAGESWFKRASSSLFHRLISATSEGPEIPLDAGEFRVMTRRAADVLQAMPEQSRFTRAMVAWVGFRQVPFPYERDARFAGTTNYSLLKMVRLALDALTGFSAAPLRIASYAGTAFAVLSLGMLGYSVLRWLEGHTVAGWTSLIAIVLMIGAVQLFVLGMIGEYIARIYNQSKKRPLYIVSDVVGGHHAPPKLGLVMPAAGPTARVISSQMESSGDSEITEARNVLAPYA